MTEPKNTIYDGAYFLLCSNISMSRSLVVNLPRYFSVPNHLQVITPTKAIARTLNISHYSLESLAEIAVRKQGWTIASSLMAHRLLHKAIRETQDNKDVEGIARLFTPTLNSLLRSGVDLNALQKYPSVRIQKLAKLALVYQKRLRERKALAPAELFWQGSQIVANTNSYLFYGYFTPGEDQIAFINAIAGDDSIMILPDGEGDFWAGNKNKIAYLEARGWIVKQDWQTEKLTPQKDEICLGKQLQQSFLSIDSNAEKKHDRVSLHVYPNLTQEVRGVLTQVKVLLTQGVAAKDIVLVARDEQLYGSTLLDIAWEYNLPLRALYEIPLEQTRIGAWLKLLLEVIETSFPFESTVKLLTHPLAGQISTEIWSKAREKYPHSLQAWLDLGLDLSCLDLPTQNSRDRWLQSLLNILETFQVKQRGKKWAREIVAFYLLQDVLVQISQPKSEQISKQTFLQEVKQTLALFSVPIQPGRGGVELHNPSSLFGASYQYVFVLGTAEGIFPTPINNDPVLDFFDRQQLAKQGFPIETALAIVQREALTFYHLLGVPTKKIVFSYPQLIERKTILPSPYLAQLQLKPDSLRDLPLASIEEARQVYLQQKERLDDPVIHHTLKAWQVEQQRESNHPQDEYDGVVGIPIDPATRVFSASQLTQLGQCPFKWFASRLLKLKELPEAETDLSTTLRGNLYHRCLELSLAKIKTTADLAKFNAEQLTKIFLQAEQDLALSQIPAWTAQRQEHLVNLWFNLITPSFLPPETEIMARETSFQMEWHGLQVKGKVDRIDRAIEGLVILDYKTSSNAPTGVKDNTGKANIDIQLPLYMDAVEQSFPNESIKTAAYYSLTKRKIIKRAKQNKEELAAFAEQVKSYLAQGYYPVEPDIEQKACTYCSFDLVCRKDLYHRQEFEPMPTSL
ncbi:MAG: PD-(D/E)XK nuclease family protein [Xenococcaceae cyanobacterium]